MRRQNGGTISHVWSWCFQSLHLQPFTFADHVTRTILRVVRSGGLSRFLAFQRLVTLGYPSLPTLLKLDLVLTQSSLLFTDMDLVCLIDDKQAALHASDLVAMIGDLLERGKFVGV